MSEPKFMPHFQEFILARVLDHKYNNNMKLVEHIIENANPADLPVEYANICARVPVPLIRQFEQRVNLLGVTKRQFVEFAIHHALNMVDECVEQYNPFEEL